MALAHHPQRCIDLLRQRRPQERLLPDGDEAGASGPAEALPDPDPLPDEIAQRADLQHLLRTAILRLPQAYREVVTLRYVADLTFAEIGTVLGVPREHRPDSLPPGQGTPARGPP